MNILITGSNGLIGSTLYDKLKLFHNVYGIDKPYGLQISDINKYDFKYYDLIIHCASNCIIRDVIKHPYLMTENINNTISIMEYCRKHKTKVVLFSSSRVGTNNHNPYSTGKRFMEEISKAYYECYGVESIIIRPETIWGLNDNKKRVIPLWIKAAMNNKPLIIYGDNTKMLPPLYIDTFIDELLKIIFYKCSYNLIDYYKITGYPMTAKEVAETIIKQTNSKSKIIYKKAELSQPQQYDTSNTWYIGEPNNFENNLKKVLRGITK